MNALGSGDKVSFADLAAIVFRRRWLMVCTFVLVGAAVSVFTLSMPKQYESHMKILVKNERADMIVSASGGDGSGYHEVSETEINSEIELLNGTNLLRHVVTQCGLEKSAKAGEPVGLPRDIAIERATLRLQHDLSIIPVRKSNIIQIQYFSRDPRQAAAVLRELAESYLEEHLKVHGTPGTYQFFASQAEHYQNELKEAETKLEAFRQQRNIVMLAQQKDAMLQRVSDSEAALMQADAAIREVTNRIITTRTELDAAPPRIVTQHRTVPNQYSVEHLSAMLSELENRRTQLLAKFRPDDRLVQEAEKEIADTRSSLEQATKSTASEQSTDINLVHQTLEIDMAKQQSELAGVEARRRALAQQAQNYRSQFMAMGDATAEYDDLTRSQKEAEQNYLLYSKKTEEARIAESLDRQKIANVAIAEPPTESYLPSKPNVRLDLTLGVMLAVFLSAGMALGAEYVRKPEQHVHLSMTPSLAAGYLAGMVEQQSDLETLTGLPVLATVYAARTLHKAD